MDLLQAKNYIQTLWQEKPKVASVIVKSRHPELYEEINCLPGKTFSEKVWSWINEKPASQCVSCGLPVKFLDYRRGYATFCSTKCQANHSTTIDQRKKTLLEKYGYDHYSKTDSYKGKFKKTCLEKHGVENPGQIEHLKRSRARKKQETFLTGVLAQIKDKVKPLFHFDEYTHLRDQTLNWQCLLCYHEFSSNLLDKLPECPLCFPKGNCGGPSSIEHDIYAEIQKFYPGDIVRNSRNIIPPKELDFYFPEHRFAIEVNGVYWHSDQQLEKDYHYNKAAACLALGVKVLMVTDYEWKSNRELLLRMIQHRLGLSKIKIYARKCVLNMISSEEARCFLEKHHIHGFSRASVHYGLMFNEELVSVVSISKRNRFSNKNILEIVRFATADVVIGAFGKILNQIKLDFPDLDISTYADLRYGTGDVYNKTGFVETHITKPGYWYFVNGRIDHRLNWTKQQLVKKGFSPEKTEQQIMEELGALRIYDCGHKHYEWKRNG